jgi:hypothetical protein
MTSTALQAHPIDMSVRPDLRRSRVTVFLRLLIVIPHLIWLTLWSLVAELAVFAAWLAALLTGRVPDPLHGFLASYLRFYTRLSAYLFLLLTYVFRLVNEVVAFLGWFYCLFTGRMHEGMQDTSTWLLRYEFQTAAYALLLTQRYPSLSGSPTP